MTIALGGQINRLMCLDQHYEFRIKENISLLMDNWIIDLLIKKRETSPYICLGDGAASGRHRPSLLLRAVPSWTATSRHQASWNYY